MMSRITRRWRWAFVAVALFVIAMTGMVIANQASAAPGGNGPILGAGNAFYVTPVYGCTKLGAESTGYVEQHSFTSSNCASGYAQFVLNTPYLNGEFILNLGSTSYSCGLIMSGMVITQINCEPPAG